eukprot:2447605-Prymnesium_polylepis.2
MTNGARDGALSLAETIATRRESSLSFARASRYEGPSPCVRCSSGRVSSTGFVTLLNQAMDCRPALGSTDGGLSGAMCTSASPRTHVSQSISERLAAAAAHTQPTCDCG